LKISHNKSGGKCDIWHSNIYLAVGLRKNTISC